MTGPRLRDTREHDQDEGGQAPTTGLARILAREDVRDPRDPRVREGMEAHREWFEDREQRRRARKSAVEQQARLTAYPSDEKPPAGGNGGQR